MSLELFAGLPVSDLDRALAWYEQLLGDGPSFRPNDTEAVWGMGEQSHLYVELLPQHAGHGFLTVFVDDLDQLLADIAGRGLEPAHSETYDNGVRKALFRDPDGNEIGFGGAPVETS